MYPLIRSILFRLPPERAHALSLGAIRLVGSILPVRAVLHTLFSAPDRPVEAFGLRFKNPVGLAAGYDKDALGWKGLASLGFGHIEVGTITPKPQPGNPVPRLFRLVPERALINRMGFPGKGASFAASHLGPDRPYGVVVGANLGKNKETPLEEAVGDYLSLFDRFAPLADYLAVNVSSPNTPGLRSLQTRRELEKLLSPLAEARKSKEAELKCHIPLLVKLAPDLEDEELDGALEAISTCGMDGVIATNTTIQRPPQVASSPYRGEAGGLSGDPLHSLSLRMVGEIHHRTAGKLPIIGVGGIRDAAGAQRMLDAGASLVQVYTGLVYEGPALVKNILLGLS